MTIATSGHEAYTFDTNEWAFLADTTNEWFKTNEWFTANINEW